MLYDVKILQVVELEGLSILDTKVRALFYAVKVENQVHKLLVVGISGIRIERYDWNSVVKMVSEAVNRIINY